MATKNLFGKRKGTYFYHYEQSFRPGEITSYDEAHRIGIELAEKMFPGYEVLVGTHLDAESDGVQRVHNHFVINSVSYENGKKIQLGPRSIERMRGLSDEICQAHNLSVLPEYKQTFGLKSIGTREYRAALKGDSWKFQCINDIEQAMTMVGSKDEFIALMESAGYTVKWSDSRKYITYTCPNGMKVRDNKLHESKFLKEYMQYEFTIRQQQSGANQLGVQEAESRVEVGASNNGHTSKGDDGVPDTEGAMGSVAKAIEHLEKASARGNMFADYRLAQIYLFESDIFDMEKAIEYLNRSAQAGNESAAVALTRMAQNTFLTITTDILNIVGNLSGIESYRQPQDCTTIPQHRPRKERKKDREWEHTL